MVVNNKSFFYKIKEFFSKKKRINDYDIDNVEKILLSSDIGTENTIKIVKCLEKNINKDDLYTSIKKIIENLFFNEKMQLEKLEKKIKKNNKNYPYVIMVVGVNGVGKTTTVGKLAFFLKKKGFYPIIGASDTFRAAAIDQLKIWSNKASVPLVKQHINADPASVAYDTLQSAISKKKDVVLIDTAGRLHNRINLMEELSKICRVMKKIIKNSPHEIVIVLDASTGQNAFNQIKEFSSFIKISSMIITKLDGTAKGGFIIKIVDKFKIPVRYIGTGEKIGDLKEFNSKKFIENFFKL